MSPTVISALLIAGFVSGMLAFLRYIHRTGRRVLSIRGLWGVFGAGYLVVGAHLVLTMDRVGWLEGLVGFMALCSVLPVAYLIRRVCPSCCRRLNLIDEVVTQPNRACPGVGARTWQCPHCGHHVVESHTIPRLAETSAESGPWAIDTADEAPGCFGGDHSSGAGGGATWGTSQ